MDVDYHSRFWKTMTPPERRGGPGKASRNKKTKIFAIHRAGIHGLDHQHLLSYGPTAQNLLKLLVFISETSNSKRQFLSIPMQFFNRMRDDRAGLVQYVNQNGHTAQGAVLWSVDRIEGADA